MLKEYPQSSIYRVPPNYSPISSQMMHHPQSTLWGYNLMAQPQQPGFFLQNQSLTPGMWREHSRIPPRWEMAWVFSSVPGVPLAFNLKPPHNLEVSRAKRSVDISVILSIQHILPFSKMRFQLGVYVLTMEFSSSAGKKIAPDENLSCKIWSWSKFYIVKFVPLHFYQI